MIIWCDIETTGLNPQSECILEIALLLTDDDLHHQSWTVHKVKPAFAIYMDKMDTYVLGMHTKNGLLAELDEFTPNHVDVEREILMWLGELRDKYGIEDFKKIPLAGSTIGFDRSFLHQWMPLLNEAFSYRSIDVSSIKELARRWYGESEVPETPEEEKAHRALADVRASVATLKDYRERFFI